MQTCVLTVLTVVTTTGDTATSSAQNEEDLACNCSCLYSHNHSNKRNWLFLYDYERLGQTLQRLERVNSIWVFSFSRMSRLLYCRQLFNKHDTKGRRHTDPNEKEKDNNCQNDESRTGVDTLETSYFSDNRTNASLSVFQLCSRVKARILVRDFIRKETSHGRRRISTKFLVREGLWSHKKINGFQSKDKEEGPSKSVKA
jgi:hypothetical protein